MSPIGGALTRSISRLSSSRSIAASRPCYFTFSSHPQNPNPRSPSPPPPSPPPAAASRHLSDWRSPLSHRAVLRSSAAVADRYERRFASMATRNSYETILTSLSKPGGGEFGKYYSLPGLDDPRIDRLPYSIRILLESAIRNCDEFQVTSKDVEKILDWENTAPKQVEIPFKPARVLRELSSPPPSLEIRPVPSVVDKFPPSNHSLYPPSAPQLKFPLLSPTRVAITGNPTAPLAWLVASEVAYCRVAQSLVIIMESHGGLGGEDWAVIIVGGATKGTRFRLLSLNVLKPLFLIADCLQPS